MFVRFLDACSACNEPQTTDVPAGLHVWTEVDLDLKAGGGVGWRWPHNSARCISCGACGVTIWGFPAGAAAFVASDEYRSVAFGPWPGGFRDEMAAGLLCERFGQLGVAFERYLIASWIAEEAQTVYGAQDPAWAGLADEARRRAVEVWIREAGDPTDATLPRCTELAPTTVVGHVLLDNQVVVDLLRRLGEWDRAAAAAASARRGIEDTLSARGGFEELFDDEARMIVAACQIALELEERLIAHRDSSRAEARLDLPPWFVD